MKARTSLLENILADCDRQLAIVYGLVIFTGELTRGLRSGGMADRIMA